MYLKVSIVKIRQVKKLVLILVISMSLTSTSKKDIILHYISYIYYLVYFQKNSNNIKTLIDSNTKIKTITSIYALKL